MISVCIASYNGADYILDQLKSILPQLRANDEIIVSDDHSTDGTIRASVWLKAHARDHPYPILNMR